MKAYDTYLFDVDGTLVDTVDLICRCFQYIAEKYANKTLPREQIVAGIGSPLHQQVVKQLGPGLDYDRILDDYLHYQLDIMGKSVSLFPGVAATLEALKTAGKRLAVVTSRRRHSLEVILSSTGIADFFDYLVTPEDTDRHKPDPEPALKAMSLLGAAPKSTVFIGDAHYDICSGAGAGIDTVFVTWSQAAVESLPIRPTWTIDALPQLCEPLMN